MFIRSNTWLADNLSWSSVIIGLGNAFEEMGHRFLPVSTNGCNEKLFNRPNIISQSILDLDKLKRTSTPVDLDLTYTIPLNFSSRFLPNSRKKAAIYAYEYQHWPTQWKKFYHFVNLYFPPSKFAAEIFIANGIPKEKVFVVPHGVDQTKFNSTITPYQLKTKKSFKFVSVVAPHSRKRIDIMLKAYCEAFTSKDDVCLVLKTKAYRKKDQRHGYEICVADWLDDLRRKYGAQMPEIELIQNRIDNIASIYTACQVNVSTTGSECFYIPGLESMACGLVNIATNFSGHLDFLNSKNSLLISYKMVPALKEDQYWHFDPRNKIAQANQGHTAELMLKSYKEYAQLREQFMPEMNRIVEEYSWKNAAQKILDCCKDKR